MENKTRTFVASQVNSQEQGMDLMDKLASIARAESVFSQPQTFSEHTIIMSSEVMSSLGFGFGGGSIEPKPQNQEPVEGQPNETAKEGENNGGGSGGGGGGFSMARPVAVIVINANGVTVQPIFDMTKIALAWVTTLARIFSIVGQFRRRGRRSLK